MLESLEDAGHFSCLGLKSGFWKIKMQEMSKQYTPFTAGNLGSLNVIGCLLGSVMPQLLFNDLCRIVLVS